MSDDIIKRSDAIKALCADSDGITESEAKAVMVCLADVFEVLRDVPFADRLQGEWIDISEWYAPRQKCSICETVVVGYGSNFCPNCGAKMKGADDEIFGSY